MGLFSSKKVTTVGTSVSRVIEDDSLPDAMKTGLLRSIVEGEGTVSEYLLEEAINSVALKAEAAYRYGQDRYIYGLPSGEMYTNTQGRQEVQDVLDTLHGGPVFMEYVRFGPPNSLHIAWNKVITNFGWNPATNELTTLSAAKGKPVYLDDLQLVIPESMQEIIAPGMVEQWGIPAKAGYTPLRPAFVESAGNLVPVSRVIIDHTATEEYVLLTAIWVDVVGDFFDQTITYPTETHVITTTEFDEEADYFHAKYQYGGSTYFWMYEVGTGTYPTLDSFFESPVVVSGEYFPFLYFRYEKQSMAQDTSSNDFKSSKKLASYFGMNFKEVVDAIHENPDIDDVEQAMCIMAVPAGSQDKADLLYLYDYFNELYFNLDIDYYATIDIKRIQGFLFRKYDPTRHTTVIQDAKFKMALSNAGLFKKRVVGNIGPIGTVTGHVGNIDFTYKVRNTRTDEDVDAVLEVPCHFYRKQISEVLYDEIQVLNLKTIYHVYGRYSVIGEETDSILLVPIDRSISANYDFKTRERLYSRSLHFVFNSRVVTKLKWYQQEWFADFLFVVAIVITVVTLGKGAYSLTVAAALGTLTISAIVWSIAVQIIRYLLVSYLVKLFVKVVGAEAAFVIALALTAYNIGNASTTASNVPGAPWAQDLLQLSSNLIKGIEQSIQDNMKDLLKEARDFEAESEQQLKNLETAQELLERNSLLSPFTIFGESPQEYFQRTVHSGNIGTIGIGAITHYVDMALTLPKISESLGDPFYV